MIFINIGRVGAAAAEEETAAISAAAASSTTPYQIYYSFLLCSFAVGQILCVEYSIHNYDNIYNL